MKKITKDELNTGGLTKEEVIRCYPGLQGAEEIEDMRTAFSWLKANTGIDYTDAWMDGGFDYIALNFIGLDITAAFGLFRDDEKTVNLIPMYTFCPACNCRDYEIDEATGLKICEGCDAIFGELRSDVKAPYNPNMTEDHSDIRYFDIRIPNFGSLPERVHGWMDRESKKVYQWG